MPAGQSVSAAVADIRGDDPLCTDEQGRGILFRSAAGEIKVCENGAGVDFSEELAKTILSEKEIVILVSLGEGSASATAWGCDLTYEYVKINGDYRT